MQRNIANLDHPACLLKLGFMALAIFMGKSMCHFFSWWLWFLNGKAALI